MWMKAMVTAGSLPECKAHVDISGAGADYLEWPSAIAINTPVSVNGRGYYAGPARACGRVYHVALLQEPVAEPMAPPAAQPVPPPAEAVSLQQPEETAAAVEKTNRKGAK
jgi:hypothetical protein